MSGEILFDAAALVADSGLPRHEAERLLAAAVGRDRSRLVFGEPVGVEDAAQFHSLVDRRRSGVPLQHLEGTVSFGPVELLCDHRALIPRPETEQLWEMAVPALGKAGPGTVIVDLCTGSGNLALALEHAFPRAQVYATDASEDALLLAKENAARLDSKVSFHHGDLYAPLPKSLRGRVDLIVANPPYVAEGEFATLDPEVRDYEPADALVAGPTGTEVLERIADEAYWWLATGGWLLCEIAPHQAEDAQGLFAALDNEVRLDLTGRRRVLVGRKGASCCS